MSELPRPAILASLLTLTVMVSLSGVLGLDVASHGTLLGVYAAAFVPYAALIFWLRPGGSPAESHKNMFGWILGAALMSRLVLMWCDPVWSDDIYRYVWDGRVAAAGINPFTHAPDAEALAGLRDSEIWPLINHKHISTIYPPVAQWVFLVNAWLGGGTGLLRALFVVLEGAMCWGVWRVVRGSPWLEQRGVWAFALYALNPTVMVEIAWSGHLDVLAYGPLTLAVLWWTSPGQRSWKHTLTSAGWLGISVAAKILPVVLIPLWLFAPRRGAGLSVAIKRRVVMVMVVGGIVVGSYVPYLDAGSQLFAGFGTYASKWRGNDGAFRALMTLSEQSFRAWTPDEMRANREDPNSKAFVTLEGLEQVYLERGITKQWEGKAIANNTYGEDQVSQTVAKLIVAALMGLAMLWALLVARDVRVGVLMLLVLLFFLAPTVYPWYVAWLVPLAAIQRRTLWGPIVFSATSLTAYVAILMFAQSGAWTVPWWGVGLGALCVGVVCIRDVWRGRIGELSTSLLHERA